MGVRASKQQVKVNHFLFKKVTLKNQFNKQLITWHKPMLRTDQFIQWENKYKKAVTMNKQSLLLPQSYDKMKIQKFLLCCQCPADTQIALTYQKFQYSLELQINTRKSQMKYFQQPQLFYIAYKLLEGCKEFQLRNEKVGDIRPKNIVKIKNGQLKLINVASFPQQYTALQKILDQFDNTTVFFLSPQQIQFLKSKGYNSGDYPNAKTQAFSLGLTLLQCATLEQSASLYQKLPLRGLNKNQLQFRINSLQSRYKLLPKYLKLMLNWQQRQRLSTGQVWAILNYYSVDICELKQFSPKQSAQKTALNQFRNKLAKMKVDKKVQH